MEANERAILAYFKSPEEAQVASERLTHELDIEDVQIDRIGKYPGSHLTNHIINPIAGDMTSLVNYVEGIEADENTRRLLTNDPDVYSMSDGDADGWASGRDILLTVVTTTEKLQDALKIIEECGGQH